jgi:glutathione S-transferase
MMSQFVVYSVPGSPYGRVVFATLEEKRASYRLIPLAPSDSKGKEHLARHPFGVLPEPSLTPAESRALARMDQVMNICDWYLFHGVSNVIGFQRIVRPRLLGQLADEGAVAQAMPNAHTVFNELSRLLADRSYFTGEALSLADLLVAPQLDFLSQTPEWEPLTAATPNIVAWLDRMTARASFQATTWERIAALAAAA